MTPSPKMWKHDLTNKKNKFKDSDNDKHLQRLETEIVAIHSSMKRLMDSLLAEELIERCLNGRIDF